MSPPPVPRKPSAIPLEMLMGLQRDVGNRVVAQLVARSNAGAPPDRPEAGAAGGEDTTPPPATEAREPGPGR